MRPIPVVDAAPSGEKHVQRRGIGMRGALRNRRVGTLLLAVGGEGVEVEGDDRSARGLCAGHTFDCRMQTSYWRLPGGDKAKPVLGRATSEMIGPNELGFRPLVEVAELAVQPEDNVLVEHLFSISKI